MDDSTITSRIKELRSEGLSLRDIASRLLEEGGPKLDPKTIGARLKEPTDSQLEHITQELRPLAMACSDLRFDPRNPNTHPEAQKAAVRASLAQFGQMKPIVANTAQKGKPVVIAGNATLEAALALGWTHIAVNRINVSDAVAKAYSAADKRTADMSEWEPSILAAILVELESEPIDMASLGFDDGFVRQAIEAAQGDDPGTGDESGDESGSGDDAPVDRADELQREWQTERGQIWEIPSKSVPGMSHRVVCGDCREPADIALLLSGRKINVAFTSPPYASQRKYDAESGFKPIKPDAYVDWFEAVQANVKANLAEDGSWFVNIKEHCEDGQRHLYVKDLTIAHVRKWGWRLVDEFCWKRKGVPGGWEYRFKNEWEPVFHFSVSDPKCNKYAVGVHSDQCFDVTSRKTKASTSVFDCNYENGKRIKSGLALPGNVVEINGQTESEHNAGFPIGLPSWFIKAFSDAKDLIFDPFLGSGTTMIAAEREGRIALGTEISPKYVAVILERARKQGLEPRLVKP